MERPLPVQQAVKLLSGPAAVHHTEDLGQSPQPLRQGRGGQDFLPAEGDPPEHPRVVAARGAQFHRRPPRQKLPEQRPQGGLGGGAEDGAGPVALHQLGDGKDTGPQTRHRQHLRFIKDDDAPRQVVQLAAAGGAGGKQRFKKLDRRGDHHRHIPIFGGLRQPDLLGTWVFAQVVQHPGVVLQHVLFPQYLPKDLGVLFDDGGIGQNIDHPFQAVGPGVAQGKGQG